MEPIDRPFRFTWDFCIVWLALAVPTFFLARQWDTLDAMWSRCIITVLLSLLATFYIYGPVLLMRQIIPSGSRGWFVARVAVTIILASALFLFSLHIFGHGQRISPVWPIVISAAASLYLHWRIDKRCN